MMRSAADVEVKENVQAKKWDTLKDYVINTKTVLLGEFLAVGFALSQIFTHKTRSATDIKETFQKIIDGLKLDPNTLTEKFKLIVAELAKETQEGVANAKQLFNALVAEIDKAAQASPELVAEAEKMRKYTVDTTKGFSDLRAFVTGSIGVLILAYIAADFGKQFHRSLGSEKLSHTVVGGVTAATMITLWGMRFGKCFSDEYESAPRGYMCSQAADDTARGFNNFLIQIGFAAGGSLLMRLLNSCFELGVRPTLGTMWTSVKSAPGEAYQRGKNAWVGFWAKPGSTVTVQGPGEGDSPQIINVRDELKEASAPLLADDRLSQGNRKR